MSLEAVVIFPLIIIIIASFLCSFCLIAERSFYDFEDGVDFLLSVPLSERTALNHYKGRVEPEEAFHLTGKMLSYLGKKSRFYYFKPSRLLYSVLFGE